jgi:hypothetical protein
MAPEAAFLLGLMAFPCRAVKSDSGVHDVCKSGSFLAMKLRPFTCCQTPEDALEILYALFHYDQGTNAALAAFVVKVRSGNAYQRRRLQGPLPRPSSSASFSSIFSATTFSSRYFHFLVPGMGTAVFRLFGALVLQGRCLNAPDDPTACPFAPWKDSAGFQSSRAI